MISALLGLAPTLILPVLRAVEGIFGAKTGQTKLEAALAALLPVLEKAAAAGKLPGIPDTGTLQTIVETVFQQNQKSIESGVSDTYKTTAPLGAVITITLPKV